MIDNQKFYYPHALKKSISSHSKKDLMNMETGRVKSGNLQGNELKMCASCSYCGL